MSLVVSAFWRDPVTGETQEFTDWADGHYMARTERTRSELWGSEAVQPGYRRPKSKELHWAW